MSGSSPMTPRSPHGLAAWITNEGPDYNAIARGIADFGELLWRVALENAAQACADMSNSPRGNDYGSIGDAFDECADAIRGLITDAPKAPEKIP